MTNKLTDEQIKTLSTLAGKHAAERTQLGAEQARARQELLDAQAAEQASVMGSLGLAQDVVPEGLPQPVAAALAPPPDAQPGVPVPVFPAGGPVTPIGRPIPAPAGVPRPIHLRK